MRLKRLSSSSRMWAAVTPVTGLEGGMVGWPEDRYRGKVGMARSYEWVGSGSMGSEAVGDDF